MDTNTLIHQFTSSPRHESNQIVSRIYPNNLIAQSPNHSVTQSPGHRVTVSLLLSAVICVLLFINLPTYQPINCLYAQEIDIKTKIKELKHKDPTIPILAIRFLRKVEEEG